MNRSLLDKIRLHRHAAWRRAGLDFALQTVVLVLGVITVAVLGWFYVNLAR